MLRHKDAAVGTAAVLVPTPPTLCVHKPAVCEIREFNKRAFVVKKTSLENFTFVNVVIDTRNLTM